MMLLAVGFMFGVSACEPKTETTETDETEVLDETEDEAEEMEEEIEEELEEDTLDSE